jgi:hypothetical protein
VLFIAAIGLLLAVFGHLMSLGVGGYSLNDAPILAVHEVILWTVVGLVVAWRMKREPGDVTSSWTVREDGSRVIRQARDMPSSRPRPECPCGFCLPQVL